VDPCDITLVVKDGKQFQVHGNVLSKASPFFERLLSSDMKESNEGVIRLHTITESQMAGHSAVYLQWQYSDFFSRKCRKPDRNGRFSSPFKS